jgi:hypothetical protein
MHPAKYVFGSDGKSSAFSAERFVAQPKAVRNCESNWRYVMVDTGMVQFETFSRLEQRSRIPVWVIKVTVFLLHKDGIL